MGKQGRKVVYGIFQNRASLESCVSNLRLEGFRPEDVSVLMPDKGDTATFAHEKGTKAPEGAAIGGGTGAVLGGTLGWLVGIGAVATIPALGPLVAAGPIMSALAGLGVGTAVGGLAGALAGLGIPEYEAKRYEKYVKDGGILISVHVDDNDWEDKAERILEASGAKDISNSTEVSQKEFRQSSSDQKTTRF
ncbi:quinol:electron acceptor oxidoreductase subunit ActD [Bdellovibrio reynosensis]|uniref:General stress protein n=1 Tax=Bdellovibrio reynosensis TaxID=2835041 RepID=A0ABY4CA01_9BACT|nr:quinol:electron acceptor oxidoreductase subunit ActD [Bdellovibrio reynosensis]UOF01793.1 general stress protein [Bdellovibrio reynosensis]